MFAQNTVSLTARRRESMDSILVKATESLAQKVVDGLVSRDDAEKIHVYAIAALASGIPGADNTAGAADRRRETVSTYLANMLDAAETDAA
jgi:hypothetical protein